MLIRFLQSNFSSKFHLMVLAYLFFGIVFLCGGWLDSSYYLTIGNMLSHKIYLSIFLLPSFLFFYFHQQSKIEQNEMMITRFQSRMSYIWFQIKSIFLHTALLLLELILLMTIVYALSSSVSFQIESYIVGGYGNKLSTTNIVYLLTRVIKVFSLVSVLEITMLTLRFFIKKTGVLALCMLGIIGLMYLPSAMMEWNFFQSLLPSNQYYYDSISFSIPMWTVCNLIYSLVVVGIEMILIHIRLKQFNFLRRS